MSQAVKGRDGATNMLVLHIAGAFLRIFMAKEGNLCLDVTRSEPTLLRALRLRPTTLQGLELPKAASAGKGPR